MGGALDAGDHFSLATIRSMKSHGGGENSEQSLLIGGDTQRDFKERRSIHLGLASDHA